jgi:hypothetical protein
MEKFIEYNFTRKFLYFDGGRGRESGSETEIASKRRVAMGRRRKKKKQRKVIE